MLRCRSALYVLLALLAACADTPIAPTGVTVEETPEDAGHSDDTSSAPDSSTEAADTAPEEPDAPQAGGFGEACDDEADCASGVCITTAESQGRRRCTDYCDPAQDRCPEGYDCAAVANSGADRTFLCFPEANFLCAPCDRDEDCGGLRDRCLVYPDGAFCGRSCDEQACPEGYDCVAGDDGASQCRRALDFCSACFDPDDDGYGLGDSCRGEDCDEGNPLIHAGAGEACNGRDDDCDGQIDEGNPSGGAACNTGAEGVCSAGTLTCQDGALACVSDRAPSPELCNGRDDDCDGRVDGETEDSGGACDTGQPGSCGGGVLRCQSAALECVASQTPRAELCNGLDDSCDGQVDEGNPGGGAACDTGELGVCSAGTLTCQDGALACPRTRGPVDELCNALDDDCDGVEDDGCPVGIATGGDTNGAAYGGTGGSPFSIACGPGQMAVGVDVRSAAELDQLTAICQQISLEERRGTTPYLYASAVTGAATRTASQGGGGGSPSTLICPAGSFLARMRVRAAARVDQLTLTCAQAVWTGYPDAGELQLTDTATATFGGEGGTLRAEVACPPGQLMAGFYGREGSRVDQLGPICRTYSVQVR